MKTGIRNDEGRNPNDEQMTEYQMTKSNRAVKTQLRHSCFLHLFVIRPSDFVITRPPLPLPPYDRRASAARATRGRGRLRKTACSLGRASTAVNLPSGQAPQLA